MCFYPERLQFTRILNFKTSMTFYINIQQTLKKNKQGSRCQLTWTLDEIPPLGGAHAVVDNDGFEGGVDRSGVTAFHACP